MNPELTRQLLLKNDLDIRRSVILIGDINEDNFSTINTSLCELGVIEEIFLSDDKKKLLVQFDQKNTIDSLPEILIAGDVELKVCKPYGMSRRGSNVGNLERDNIKLSETVIHKLGP